MLRKSQWDQIRRSVYEDYDYRCGVCQVEPRNTQVEGIRQLRKQRLECHEVWEYEDESSIQNLKGLIALCEYCHRVKHMGFVKHIWDKGVPENVGLAKTLRRWRDWKTWSAAKYSTELKLPKDEQDPQILQVLKSQINAIMPEEHFVRVNECDINVAEEHIKAVATDWGLRSQRQWQVNFGEFARLLTNPA